MDTVTSKDGSTVAFTREGDGEPVLLVHGMLSDHTIWFGVAPQLAERFTVYAVNRRGRAPSSELASSGWQQQYQDLRAIVDAAGAPVHVVGHSFGAVVALGFALREKASVRSVALCEPPPTVPALAGLAERLGRAVDAGQPEAAVIGLLETLGATTEIIAGMKQTPFWPLMVSLAPTIAPELRMLASGALPEAALKSLDVPVLLMNGADSPVVMRQVCRGLDAALPSSTRVELDGQGHFAPALAPQVVVDELLAFWNQVVRENER